MKVNTTKSNPVLPGLAPLRDTPPTLWSFTDHTNLFSSLIARTAKDIEQLVDSLPSEESSAELQASSLRKLEEENAEAADKLAEVRKINLHAPKQEIMAAEMLNSQFLFSCCCCCCSRW